MSVQESAAARTDFVRHVIATQPCEWCGAPVGEQCHTAYDRGERNIPGDTSVWVHHPREVRALELLG